MPRQFIQITCPNCGRTGKFAVEMSGPAVPHGTVRLLPHNDKAKGGTGCHASNTFIPKPAKQAQ